MRSKVLLFLLLFQLVIIFTIQDARAFAQSVKEIEISNSECRDSNDGHSVKFSENLTPYSIKGLDAKDCGLVGFLDSNLEVAIPPKFESARPFSEGLAAVSNNGKWGFINKSGEFVIPAIYENVRNFRSSLAFVTQSQPKFTGYIDQRGKKIIDFTKIEDFANVTFQKNDFMRDQKTDFEDFSDGILSLTVSKASGIKVGQVLSKFTKNMKVQLVINEYFCYKKKDSALNTGALTIDTKGVVKSVGKYSFIAPFSEGLAYAQLENCGGKLIWQGFINSKGAKIIDLKAHKSSDLCCVTNGFHEGLADFADISSYKRGFINKQGNWVIQPKFGDTSYFKNGFVSVQDCTIEFCQEESSPSFLIDKRGIPFQLQGNSMKIASFIGEGNLIRVFDYFEPYDFLGLADKSGNLIWPAGKSNEEVVQSVAENVILITDEFGNRKLILIKS